VEFCEEIEKNECFAEGCFLAKEQHHWSWTDAFILNMVWGDIWLDFKNT